MLISRHLSKIFRTLKVSHLSVVGYSESGIKIGDKFFDPEIQKLLRKITNVDLTKVFRSRKLGDKLRSPVYKFMTTEELNDAMKDAEKKAEHILQMPPVLDQRTDINEIIEENKYLDGHDTSNFIFTDISYGSTDQDRIVVVRETNGKLRKAFWEEREKMNQIYYPKTARELKTPKMFSPELLKDLLDREEYIFILDRACVQFEPDDPEYIRVTHETYERINDEKHFDVLRSTRHFGPIAFYLVFNKKMDNLLLENIQTERIDDAISLVHLYHIIHPDSKSTSEAKDYSGIGVLKSYIENDSTKKSILELALQSYIELQKQKKEIQDGVQRAHGN